MKRTLLMLLMVGVTVGAMAQTTREVKGTVIDKNGNPLPGAKIEATGGAENTVTDADGTFSMEVPRYLKSLTATYPGMRTKKLKIENNNDLLFEMRKGSKNHWFINAMMAHGFDLLERSAYIGEGGVMFGQFLGNKWGWYVRGMGGKFYEGDVCGSATVGALRNIKKSVYGYVGFGYGTGARDYYYWRGWGSTHYGHETINGIAIDLGVITRLNHHLNVVAGLSAQGWDTSRGYAWRLSLQLGVGYTF